LSKSIFVRFFNIGRLVRLTASLEKKVDQSKKLIVICIPAFNEEKNIAKLIIDAKKYSEKIIVIDDGSSDYTSKIVEEMGVSLIRHQKNLGKGAALRTGFLHAMTYSPDVVVTMDADGQHEPFNIPKLIEPIISGECDLVIGSRSANTKMPKYRKFGYNVISYLNKKATNSKINDAQSGFRAYSKKSINVIAQERYQDYSAEFEQLNSLLKKGFAVKEVPVELKYEGLENTSKKNFLTHGGELILASLFMIVSKRPILYLTLPGTIFLLVGLAFALNTLFLFNDIRYFSLPMSILSASLLILGALFVLSSMFIYIITKLQNNSN